MKKYIFKPVISDNFKSVLTRGAEANAIYYTLVATAKINKLNVYKYFKYLFDQLPNQKRSDIEAFLPWVEEVQQVCHN